MFSPRQRDPGCMKNNKAVGIGGARWPETVVGGKYVRMLERHLGQVRATAAHGNRQLFYDDVLIAHLLAFFNPTLRSLRTLEDFSQTCQAQRYLSVRRLCKSTLADFHRVVDPQVLTPLVRRLQRVVASRRGSLALPDLPATFAKVLAVDGTFFAVAADVAWAVRHRAVSGRRRAKARLDVHLDVQTWLPESIAVNGSETSEATYAAQHVQPGALHIYDRGIFSFELLEAEVSAGAWFVHRVIAPGERGPKFHATQSRPLSAQAATAGFVADRVGYLVGSSHRSAPEALLRELVITPPEQPGTTVRLLTNLLDLEAEVLGTVYRYRWQVELFFRWLKVYAHFDHLLSESRGGVLLSFYVAVIGVLLLYLHTGAKPSKYAFSLLGLVATGTATLEEIGPILLERERRIALERARVARRRMAQPRAG